MPVNALPPYVEPVEYPVQIKDAELSIISFNDAVLNLQKRSIKEKVFPILPREELGGVDPEVEEDFSKVYSDKAKVPTEESGILINPENEKKRSII